MDQFYDLEIEKVEWSEFTGVYVLHVSYYTDPEDEDSLVNKALTIPMVGTYHPEDGLTTWREDESKLDALMKVAVEKAADEAVAAAEARTERSFELP